MAGKGKVLLMDDEQVILDVTNEVLRFLGYDVMFARDGKSALDLYQQEQLQGNPFDLVILDLSIPEGMGGRETFEKLHALYPEAKIVISSGFTNDPMLTNPSAFGLAGVLAKPYRITEVKALLENMIPKKSSGT